MIEQGAPVLVASGGFILVATVALLRMLLSDRAWRAINEHLQELYRDGRKELTESQAGLREARDLNHLLTRRLMGLEDEVYGLRRELQAIMINTWSSPAQPDTIAVRSDTPETS